MNEALAPTTINAVAPAAAQFPADEPPRCGVIPDVVGIHAQLLRFAKSQLRNATLAEDAVSESVLAALASSQTFSSRSQATAWLFGVLRHKLVDQLRLQHRESPTGDLAAQMDGGSGSSLSAWCEGPNAMNDPELACRQSEFIQALDGCCSRLSANQAQAFVMRDVWGLDASTISQRLNVTENHFWVLLHRARQHLRMLVPQAWPMQAE